jgi:hypothetical protein
VRLEVFTTVVVMMMWHLAKGRLVARCHRFGETYWLHLGLKAQPHSSPRDGDGMFSRNVGIC